MSTHPAIHAARVASTAALLLLAQACTPLGGAPETPSRALQPSFGPVSGSSGQPGGAAGGPTSTASGPRSAAPSRTTAPPPTASATPTDAPGTPAPAAGTASIADPENDVEPGRPLATPPGHADLTGATLRRDGDTFTLRIEVAGGAPDVAEDDRHTTNIASFYDVDGDGTIDYEVWANLSSSGWGTSQFDNDTPTARYGADDDVTVAVRDGILELTFPSTVLGDAARFRWALAAEWGTYEDLQVGTMSRDLAPDDQQPASFPG